MDAADAWRSLFESWPESLPRQGLVVTNYGDQIPFVDFLVSGGILLLARNAPDTQGARKVMLSYGAIVAVKSTDPGELARYQVMGFQPPM
jgi:hypothetical protein